MGAPRRCRDPGVPLRANEAKKNLLDTRERPNSLETKVPNKITKVVYLSRYKIIC